MLRKSSIYCAKIYKLKLLIFIHKTVAIATNIELNYHTSKFIWQKQPKDLIKFKTMKKIHILNRVLFVILVSALMFSCEKTINLVGYGSVTGKVVDANTLLPLEGVSIVTVPASVSVITGEDGTFSISDVEAGDIRVNGTKPGYKSGSVNVQLLDKKTVDITMTMVKEDENLVSVFFSGASPQAGAINQPLSVMLNWHFAADSNQIALDSIFYNVAIYNSDSPDPVLIAENISDTIALAENLQFETTYFWQVIAFENTTEVGRSEVFSFKTVPYPVNHFIFSRLVDGQYDIFSAKEDGSDLVNLSDYGVANDWYAQVSPLKDMIAFVSTRSVDANIYTMDMNGKNQRKITTLPLAGYHNPGTGFCWSPDGGQILYPSYDKLYIIDRDGTDLKFFAQAPQGRHWREVYWNGYTHKIVALTMGVNVFDTEIYSMNEDGSGLTMLFDNQPGRMDSPSLSINGKNVLYTQDLAGFNVLDGRQLNAHIMTKNFDSLVPQDLSINKVDGTNDLFPRYSPDGASIIFVNTSNTGTGPHSIWRMAIDGSNREKLFDNATLPEWW